MAKQSAGLLMVSPELRVLLVHPGGPFFKRRDEGVWSIPKGLAEPGETFEEAARREFREELGCAAPSGPLFSLGAIKQGGGKVVHGFACTGTWDPRELASVTFELEWPPRSGRLQLFPEVDRAEFFTAAEAEAKIIAAQRPFIERAIAWANAQAR